MAISTHLLKRSCWNRSNPGRAGGPARIFVIPLINYDFATKSDFTLLTFIKMN